MKARRKRYPPIVELLLVLSLIIAIITIFRGGPDSYSAPRGKIETITGPGTLQVDGGEPMELLMEEGINVNEPVNETVIRFALPEVAAKAGTLSFRSTQASVEVRIGGKLAYTYLMDNVSPFEIVSSMPYIHIVDLDEDMAGELVEVYEYYPKSRFFGNWVTFSYGRGAEIECFWYSEQWEGLLFALLLFTISIFSIVMTIFSRERDKKLAHLATAVVNIVFMLWLISQTHSKQIVLVNPVLSCYLMFASIFLLPSSLLGFLYTHYEFSSENRGLIQLFIVTSTFLLAFVVLAVLDMLGVVPLISLLVPASCFCMLICINILIYAIRMNRHGVSCWSFIQALVLILLSFILEEVFLVLKIHLKSPILLHSLMFAGALTLFLKSVALLFSDNDKQGIKKVLSQEMMIDPLTGVFSRMAYEDFLENFHRNRSKSPAFIFMVDANGLKIINDEQGHSMGDTLLKSIAESLLRVFEDGDVFRIGGDEFLVYIENDEEHDLAEYCDAFRADLDDSFSNAASIGGAVYDPKFRNDIHEVIHNADLRMYHVKHPSRF